MEMHLRPRLNASVNILCYFQGSYSLHCGMGVHFECARTSYCILMIQVHSSYILTDHMLEKVRLNCSSCYEYWIGYWIALIYAVVGSQNHPAKFNPIYCSVWKVPAKKGSTRSTWVKPVINSLVQVCTSTVRSLVPRLHLSWGNGLVNHSLVPRPHLSWGNGLVKHSLVPRPHLSISVWSGHKTKQSGPKFLLDPPYNGNQFQVVDENRLTIFIVLTIKIVSLFSSI